MNYTVVEQSEYRFQQCCEKVPDGRSMIRGLQNYRPCQSPVVHGVEDETGKRTFFCTRHAKDRRVFGYTPPAKEPRYTFIIHFTNTTHDKKSWCWSFDAKNERGARMSFSRNNKDCVIDRIFVKPKGSVLTPSGELGP